MGTLVCFHAHPDDEAIATGGTMAAAAAAGHRVVLVLATRGEHGEIRDGVLEEGEQLGLRRIAETFEAAAVLGASRVEFLGYVDSGMAGTPENDGPYAFWRADVDDAARRLAVILEEEDADVLTVYDHNGGYGHPDHIQVHRVGVAAARMVGLDEVYEATMNRDRIRASIEEAREQMSSDDAEQLPDIDSEDTEFGMPEEAITHGVDVSAHLSVKRESMICHRSQIGPEFFFLQMDTDAFARAFGVEWFIKHGIRRAEGEPFGTAIIG